MTRRFRLALLAVLVAASSALGPGGLAQETAPAPSLEAATPGPGEDEATSLGAEGASGTAATERAPPAPSEGGAPVVAALPIDAGALDGGLPTDAAVAEPDAGVPDAGVAGPSEAAGDRAGAPAAEGAAAVVEVAAAVASTDVVRTLLGLVLLLALAWIGGLPAVRRLEERMGISQVITSGLPFVGLGLLMHAPGIDVLSDATLVSITPLLQFGLGWIGFHTGFQFEARAMDEVPRGTGTLVVLLTSFPFFFIAGACGLVMVATGLGPEGLSFHELPTWPMARALLRDAALVGLAGALSAPTLHRIAGGVPTRSVELSRAIGVLDDVFGVIALACLAAWLRPGGSSGGWTLPGVGWLFVIFGMSVTLGLVVYALLRNTDSSAERSSLLLGAVCFTAGMAGVFRLPPLVVCFLAGVLLRNLPGDEKADLSKIFDRIERPIYLVFLLIVGALWQIDDWRGWLLLVVFVLARVAGRWVGARTAAGLPADARPAELEAAPSAELVTPPMGQLAIAFVVSAQTLYESAAIRAIVTAVIGGSVLTEIIVQLAARRGRASRVSDVPPPDPEAAAPTDEAVAAPEEGS